MRKTFFDYYGKYAAETPDKVLLRIDVHTEPDVAVVDDLEQLRALRLELLDGLAALLVAELECELGHAVSLSA